MLLPFDLAALGVFVGLAAGAVAVVVNSCCKGMAGSRCSEIRFGPFCSCKRDVVLETELELAEQREEEEARTALAARAPPAAASVPQPPAARAARATST